MKHTRQFSFVIIFFVMVGCMFMIHLPVKTWMQEIGVTGPLGHLFWISLMALAAILPIPSEPIMTASIRTSGLLLGTVDNLLGTLAGAIILFGIGRLISGSVDIWLGKIKASRMKRFVLSRAGSRNFVLVLTIQLLPFPFLLVNLLLGSIRDIRFLTFVSASFVGFLPYQVVWDGVMVGFLHQGTIAFLVSAVAVVIVVFTVYVSFHLEAKSRQSKQNS